MWHHTGEHYNAAVFPRKPKDAKGDADVASGSESSSHLIFDVCVGMIIGLVRGLFFRACEILTFGPRFPQIVKEGHENFFSTGGFPNEFRVANRDWN